MAQSFKEIWAQLALSKEPIPVGPPHDPTALLHGNLTIGGLSLHLELHAVHDVPEDPDDPEGGGEQMSVLPPSDSTWSGLANALGGTGPFETLTFNGREYAVIAFPFCR